MLQTESPPLRVSRQLFEQLTIENPDTRHERASDGTLIVMPPTGSETSSRNVSLSGQLWSWNEATGLGKAFDSNGGFELPDSSIHAADAACGQTRDQAAMRETNRRSGERTHHDATDELGRYKTAGRLWQLVVDDFADS